MHLKPICFNSRRAHAHNTPWEVFSTAALLLAGSTETAAPAQGHGSTLRLQTPDAIPVLSQGSLDLGAHKSIVTAAGIAVEALPYHPAARGRRHGQ